MTDREYMTRIAEMTEGERWDVAMHLTEYERKLQRETLRADHRELNDLEFETIYSEQRLLFLKQKTEEEWRAAGI